MKNLAEYIRSDLYRYSKRTDLKAFVRHYLLTEGFNYTFWLRLATAAKWRPMRLLLLIILKHKQRQFGIIISPNTNIGYGFYIGHFGNIVVNPTAIIGNNCNISQGVTIGANIGLAAVIGDNVYIGPNCCIIEHLVIGNDVTIGAGSVVVRDVEDGATVAGVPARILKSKQEDTQLGRFIHNKWRLTPLPLTEVQR